MFLRIIDRDIINHKEQPATAALCLIIYKTDIMNQISRLHLFVYLLVPDSVVHNQVYYLMKTVFLLPRPLHSQVLITSLII